MPVLVFRAARVEDALEFLYAVKQNRDHLLPWLTTPARVWDLASAKDEVAPILLGGSPARFVAFCGDSLVASSRVFESDGESSVEIGMWCSRDWVRRGVGRWLLLNTVERLFSIGIERIIFRCAAANIPSRRLASTVGAVFENSEDGDSIRGKMLVYGITRKTWKFTKIDPVLFV
jgi:RimJ/RimL family protein N-acetyltransferase